MLIQGKRGRVGMGFSLKSTNGDSHYSLYVWDPRTYDPTHVKIERDKRKQDPLRIRENYSKVSGWKKIGNYPEDISEVWKHLTQVYGIKISLQEVQDELNYRWKDQEKKRLKRLEEKNKELEYLSMKLDVPFEYSSVMSTVKRRIKKLKEMEKKEN